MSEKAEESSEAEGHEHYETEYCEEEEYYVKAFKRLDETGKNTWNWAAFFFGPAWMAYRKMYLYAFLFVVIRGVFEFRASSLFAFNIYGNFSSLHLLENEHQGLYLSISVFSWLACSILMGYFGNALYYNAVKKKIRKGYHLLRKYRPTSILSALCVVYSPFICFADWISRRSQLKTSVESKVNEKTVRAYLNPNKENHLSVKIANVLICLWLVLQK